MRKSHPQVEFHVEAPGRAVSHVYKSFDEAAGNAVALAASTGNAVTIDVVIWSTAGARFWGGDDAVAQYNEDPDASVFERIVVRADAQGRVR